MKSPRRIDFTLIFDQSDNLWPSLSAFEYDLGRFFTLHGVSAKMTKNIEGQSGFYTLFLSKIETVKNMPTAKPQPPKKQMANVREKIGGK